jgi:hypothetical protein
MGEAERGLVLLLPSCCPTLWWGFRFVGPERQGGDSLGM